MGAKIRNQNYNDQVEQEGKNKKNEAKLHSNQGEFAWVGEGCFLPRPTNMSLQNGGKGKITILSPITFHFLLFFMLLNIYIVSPYYYL